MTYHPDRQPIIHSVGDVLVQTGYVLGPRVITDYELVYFPDGTGTVYELEGNPIVLDKEGFVFTRPGIRHQYAFDPEKNVRHLFVHFEHELFRLAETPFSPLLEHDGWLPVGANHLVPGLMKQILRVAHMQGPRWKERMTALLAAVLEELCADADRSFEERPQLMPAQIASAVAFMEEHLCERITIEEIARQSGWSHEHFTRVFISFFGISPKRSLIERRIHKAEQLMMSGQWTIKQIAYKVGFGDEHHFSKMYKTIRGFSASEYVVRCKNPLFRHTANAVDPENPYPLNMHIIVN